MNKIRSLQANKGEWSEFYALIKILSDWEIYGADQNLNLKKSLIYPILEVINQKGSNHEKIYKLESDAESIIIYTPKDKSVSHVKRSSLKGCVKDLFNAIKSGSGSSFEIKIATDLMQNIESVNIRAGSFKKADIFLVIHDLHTGLNPEVGFSIKSKLGGASTLLNASGATNFEYEIEGDSNINSDTINNLSGKPQIKDMVKKLDELGGSLKYVAMDNATFRANLRKIDLRMDQIVAEMLKAYFLKKRTKLTDIVEYLESKDPLGIKQSKDDAGLYKYKIETLLEKVALGMVPNTPWDGKHQATGGYIIVKEDGEIACYHLYNLNEFRLYLLNNTKLDTPSSARHRYGNVYKKQNRLYIKLNLQIRFFS